MPGIDHLQKVRFHFRFRKDKAHPELVEMVKNTSEAELEKARASGLMQKLFILITDDREDPLYAEAFKMYSLYCNGMSNVELLEYAQYLNANFGFEMPKKYFEFNANSSQPQQQYQKHHPQTQRG